MMVLEFAYKTATECRHQLKPVEYKQSSASFKQRLWPIAVVGYN